ncbi:glycoside hydrolase family 36 protein [Nonomuraea sp. NPDC003709]|uniref:glycoside hydrolase family 36 protein n=1 Tax=Nonomuraea sp. NPDC003709 TaxID=3154450 RepID=UPI0033B8763A
MEVTWRDLVLDLTAGAPPRLLAIGPFRGNGRSALPVVQIEVTGRGRSGTSGKRHVDGLKLRYESHRAEDERLTIHSGGDGVSVTTVFQAVGPVLEQVIEQVVGQVVRCWSTVTATDELVLEHVSSFAFAGLPWDLTVWSARNPWSGEFRWSGRPLELHDVGMTRFGQTGTKNRVALTSTGSWPSSEHLPTGWLECAGGTLAWQIEHNGPWHAELADRFDDVYLALSGPSQREHGWSARLAPGESFTTATAAFTVAGDPVAALTTYRRAVRGPHRDNAELPVVFNDFMNCLMGDPSTERLLPLIEAAARVGAEYFCVDAGWYDDSLAGPGDGGVPGWWDTVGAWEPSTVRFPGGIGEVIDAIKGHGMVPGLWLEPEVIGVRSGVALPEEAFLRRAGTRLTEWGRHQLDLSHPAAVAHLDAVIDRLVREHGIGYFKFDYNIDIGPADRLLEHNRAYLAWVERLLERHPGLVIESCAAGGMRLDGATLARHSIASLTDQQDELLLPAIAAAAPAAVPPEQGAMWAYPAERVAWSMVTAMLGRIHLSGRLDLLAPDQLAEVAEAIGVYKSYRGELAHGLPRWPLGLPGWQDDRLALAVDCGDTVYLAVWRRGAPSATIELPWPSGCEVTPLFPSATEAGWQAGTIGVVLPEPYSAALLRLTKGAPCHES